MISFEAKLRDILQRSCFVSVQSVRAVKQRLRIWISLKEARDGTAKRGSGLNLSVAKDIVGEIYKKNKQNLRIKVVVPLLRAS